MKKQGKSLTFGEEVEGFTVPVLNEREIRAAAGMMFLALFISFVLILFNGNFLLVKYVIVVFFTDFSIRVLVSPRFSPALIAGRLIVGGQAPEYVGAKQKKFAWTIGLALSGLMFVLLVVLNSYSVFTGVTCLVCLFFLFFESAFGICLGCLVYELLTKNEAVHCAGEACSKAPKQAIQKTTGLQLFILVGCLIAILAMVIFFNEAFRVAPKNLKEILHATAFSGALNP